LKSEVAFEMNCFYVSFAILCIMAFGGSVPEAQAEAAGETTIAKEGIETLEKGLDLYRKHLVKIIPWEEFNKITAELNEHLSDSTKAAALIGEIKSKLMAAMDAYLRETQNIYEWCGMVMDLLVPYKSLFDGEMNQEIYSNQRDIIAKVLTEGIAKMQSGKENFSTILTSFNRAYGKVVELNRVDKDDFKGNSELSQAEKADISKKVGTLQNIIGLTRGRLSDEIIHIGELQNKVLATRVFLQVPNTDNIKAGILRSVDNLLLECKEYRDRHNDYNSSE